MSIPVQKLSAFPKMLNIINIILIRLSNLFVMADYNFYISNVLLERVSEGRHYRENYLKKKKKRKKLFKHWHNISSWWAYVVHFWEPTWTGWIWARESSARWHQLTLQLKQTHKHVQGHPPFIFNVLGGWKKFNYVSARLCLFIHTALKPDLTLLRYHTGSADVAQTSVTP